MIKNWSKGTQPLVLQQTGSTQDASTKEGLLSLVQVGGSLCFKWSVEAHWSSSLH
jgi:hypothetical protein